MADYNFVQNPPEAYVCQICSMVLWEPHVTECCGQHYCKACLENWFVKNGGRTCPHCRAVNFNHMLYKPFQRKIGELEIYCTHRPSGCQVIMPLSDLKKHLDGNCQYVVLPCPNSCGISVSRMNLITHLHNQCQFRLAPCAYCKIAVPFAQHVAHAISCNQRPVHCIRNCGVINLRYCDLQGHEDVCPNVPLRCQFYEAGCNNDILRKNYDNHMATNTVAHLSMVYSSSEAKFNFLKTECDELRQENETLIQENEQLKTEVERVREDFESFKRNQEQRHPFRSFTRSHNNNYW